MLITFSIKNYLSYKDEATFSMVASQEKQHKERCPFLKDYKLRLLPVATIYGGNASGKTNLFKALNFSRQFILQGTQSDNLIPVEPYRLQSGKNNSASCFSFELYLDGKCYEYGFSISQQRVEEEWLVYVMKTTEKDLFRRRGESIQFDSSLDGDEFLHFAFQGTRENQLFLTNSVQQKVKVFEDVYKWFKDSLVLISPDTRFGPFEHFMQEGSTLYDHMNDRLSQLDTGIHRLCGEGVAFDQLPIPEAIKNKIQVEVKEGDTVRIESHQNSEFYTISRIDGELVVKKLMTYHLNELGEEVKFEISQESDGSKRVIDLLPIFLDLPQNNQSKCFVIDEVDRSLHTLLTRQLLNGYLDQCSVDSRSQLLITTHDVMLMDQELFRRDEMWIAERSESGSRLVPFSDYKDVRNDKDIRKSYLRGRLGGIPNLLMTESVELAKVSV